MNVLVAGGAGYIGSHAVKQLIEAGHRVTVVDNLCADMPKPSIAAPYFIKIDLADTPGIDGGPGNTPSTA